MTSILLTGSSGMVATHLREVLALDLRDARRHELFLASRRCHWPLESVTIGNPWDYIVHTAAMPYGGNALPIDTFLHDLQLTRYVLQLARESSVPTHVVFLSSSLVYPTSAYANREDHRGTPDVRKNPIGAAKIVGEEMLQALADSYPHVTYSILRIANVVTPHEPHDRPGHVIVDLYRKIFVDRLPVIELVGWDAKRTFTWAGDIAAAIEAVLWMADLDSGRTNRVLNVGSADSPIDTVGLAAFMISRGRALDLLPDDYRPAIVCKGEPSPAAMRVMDVGAAEEIGITCPTGRTRVIDLFLRGKAAIAKMPA